MSRDQSIEPRLVDDSLASPLPFDPDISLSRSIQLHPEGPADDGHTGETLGAVPLGLAEQVAAVEAEAARLRVAEKALLESNDALCLLSETANELMSSDRPQELIASLFRKLSVRLGLEAYVNYLVDEDTGKLHLNSYAGIPPEVAREIEWLDYGQAVCGCVARDACRIVAEDIQHSEDIRTDLVRSFGITAYACHPLMAHGRVVGTFSFGTSRKPHFEPHELTLMQAVCDQVSLSMERILLIAQLRRREAAQRFLAEAGALLSSSLEYEVTLRAFARLVVGEIADWCIVDVSEAGRAVRRLAVASSDPERGSLGEEIERGDLLAPDQTPMIARVTTTGQPGIYPDLSEALSPQVSAVRDQRTLAELDIRSAMIVPISGRGGVLGAVTFLSAGSGRRYGSDDLTLAKELACRIAIAVENSRLYRESRQAVQIRDEFLSVAAHELKTPLTSLRGFAQVLARQIERGQQIDQSRLHKTLRVVDQQSEKLAHLVTRLLDVSCIESGQLTLARRKLELGELVRAAIDKIRIALPEHEVAVHVHEPIWAVADQLRLEQVIRNLVDNAVRFSPPEGRIDVDVWSPEIGTARISVRDRGKGIPPERRDRVFDRFYQAHSADHSSGIGLGLYISRHIVQLHDGTIEAEFPADGGTRFVITLPTVLAEVKRQWNSGELGR